MTPAWRSCCTPSTRWPPRKSLSIRDLENEPLINYDSSPSTENTRRLFADAGLHPKLAYSLPQVVLVNAMVGRGLGYGLLMARPNNPSMTLEGLPVAIRDLEPPNSPSAVVAIWPQSSTLSPRAEAFLDHCHRCHARGLEPGAERDPAMRAPAAESLPTTWQGP